MNCLIPWSIDQRLVLFQRAGGCRRCIAVCFVLPSMATLPEEGILIAACCSEIFIEAGPVEDVLMIWYVGFFITNDGLTC